MAGALGPSFAAATHAGWWICVGLGLVCLALGLLSTTAWAEETARQTAERFRDSDGEGESSASPRTRYGARELAPS